RSDFEVIVDQPVGSNDRVIEGCHAAAFAGEFGGDPLKNLGRELRVDQDTQIRLAQHVDEAGRHHHARYIDGLFGPGIDQGADGCDASIANAEVAGVPGGAGAVDDVTVTDDDVVLGLLG